MPISIHRHKIIANCLRGNWVILLKFVATHRNIYPAIIRLALSETCWTKFACALRKMFHLKGAEKKVTCSWSIWYQQHFSVLSKFIERCTLASSLLIGKTFHLYAAFLIGFCAITGLGGSVHRKQTVHLWEKEDWDEHTYKCVLLQH